MLFPAGPFAKMLVRDVHARADLGAYALLVEVEVGSAYRGHRCCGAAVHDSHAGTPA
jgi:hypothetical protein